MDRRWIAVLGHARRCCSATWNLAFFTVPQWMQAIVVQLGEPVRTCASRASTGRFPSSSRCSTSTAACSTTTRRRKEILTVDKQQLVVDNYSRWRIVDPLQFYRTVRDENGAQSRLDDIIYSNVRETLGRHTLREIVSDKRDDLHGRGHEAQRREGDATTASR